MNSFFPIYIWFFNKENELFFEKHAPYFGRVAHQIKQLADFRNAMYDDNEWQQ